MKKIVVEGGKILSGNIEISGAKNSAVALLPAALLTDDTVEINNVPLISDIEAIKEILEYLGAKVIIKGHTIKINSKNVENKIIPEELAKKLRASYYFIGSLLGKFKHAEMSFPGGCTIGARPIDLHLKGFELLGCSIEAQDMNYLIKTEKLIGTSIDVKHSVGATINMLLASVLATGTTIINNAAMEPEIGNVVEMLIGMGAKIDGKDTDKLIITGVNKLSGTTVSVIPDRIEAGTYLIAGAIAGNNLNIRNICVDHIISLLDTLKQINVPYTINKNSITISKGVDLKPINIKTDFYPGFPTDLQQPITTLLTLINGKSTINETIYENRFKHIKYLNNMGASIQIVDRTSIIAGSTALHGKKVIATDLRAGACMVLAGLIADGKTEISEVNHILRGYENMIEKLQAVGAKIDIVEI